MRIRLLWGVLAVATGIAWTSWAGGVPALVVGAYWAAWAWGVVGPGILVHRAMRGRPSTMVDDVALGAAVGLVLQLAAWAAITALGLQHLLLWWPALVVLVFAGVPRLRRHFSLRPYEQRVPTGAAALAVTGFLVAAHGVIGSFGSSALPPKAMVWYQDDLWNLGNVAELMRTVAPQVAQVAGRPFYYHWFSDAHLAAMTLTTSIDPVTIVGRLWAPPMLLVSGGVTMAVGRRLSGSAWVGAAAAFCFAVAPSLEVSSWLVPAGASATAVHSPSQIFAVPLTLLAIDLLVSIVRRREPPRTWLLLTVTLVACAGAKSSVLPVLFGGLALAALVALLTTRHRLRALLSTVALTLAVLLLTQSRLAGGQNGSTLQPLATLKASGPWTVVSNAAKSGVLEPGLGANGTGRVLVLLLVSYLASYLWLLAGATALRRTDLAGWFLLGTGLAGLVGLLTIRHPAYSQIYFLKVGVVAWQLLALWGYGRSIATARHGAGGRATLRAAIGGGVIGAALLLLARLAGGPAPSVPLVSGVTSSLERSLLVVTAATALGAVGLFVARRRLSGASTALVVVGLASAVLSAGLFIPARRVFTSFGVSPSQALVVVGVAVATVALLTTVRGSRRRVGAVSGVVAAVVAVACVALVVTQSVVDSKPAVAGPVGPTLVTADEVAAARWLGQHAGQYDIVATNVHCLPTRTTTHCDARAFWVSGLSGRRVLVEGWGYTDAAQAAAGRGGLGFSRQLFDDKALFALNEGVFTNPSPEKARKLYALGVRWLFADRLAGPVSAGLAAVASPQFRSGPVTVYRLTSPRPAGTTR
ncbi:MAG: hypothetical protein ABI112_00305 [Terracoccus sp.]